MPGRLILALLLALAATATAAADELSISGKVTYRERIALPPEAMLRVRLVDMGSPDAPVVVEAESTVASPGEVPLTFTLRFDEALLRPGRSYAVAAEITSAGQLWFSTFSPVPVDPVAGTMDQPIVLSFAGRTLDAEEPREAPQPPPDDAADPALLDVVWHARALRGEPIDPAQEVSLSIANDLRAGGRGGCNSYFAQVWLQGAQLRFSSAAATRMACSDPATAELEAEFFAALEAVRLWRVSGHELLLLDGANEELLRFTAASR